MKALLARPVAHWAALTGLLLIPIWLTPHAPLFDYANHLLEAQVVVHYADPVYAYAASYALRPTWLSETNALTTTLLIALGQVMPMMLAGQLVLSGYIALFTSGLWRWIEHSHAPRALLWLTPILVYNLTYTAGWLNFAYGTALALHAFAICVAARRGRLWLIALLLVAIYWAHVMVWLLAVLVLAVLLACEPGRWRAWLALHSAIPLMAGTWPDLALAALVVVPSVWLGVALVHWLKLSAHALALWTVGLISGLLLLIKFGQAAVHQFLPEFNLIAFNKGAYVARVFALPQQFAPTLGWLDVYNVSLVLALAALAGWLAWTSARGASNLIAPSGLALAGLAVLYVALPGDTPYLRATEPRTLLMGVLVALALVRWPQARWANGIVASLGLIHWMMFIAYTLAFARQAEIWHTQLSALPPAQRLLVFTPQRAPAPWLSRVFDSAYRGVNFSTVYALERGGYVSQTFNNGPVRPQPGLPAPIYYWGDAENLEFVAARCGHLWEAYQIVVVWGEPSPALHTGLETCFGPATHTGELTVWQLPRP